MAFGEYIGQNFGKTIPTTDVAQLIGNVQTALQGRFDTNSAKLEEMIQNVSSIPLIREKDKKYLGERLNGLLNTVNANLKVSGGKGLLNNSVTTEINRYISTAIDDNVKQQLSNSQNVINFQKGVADLKGKKDGGYSDGNYAYALDKAGYDKWRNGETDSLGSLEYNPYRDVIGEAMEKATKLKNLKGDQEIERAYVDPRTGLEVPGRNIKVKISGLTAEEIIKYTPGFLSPQDEKQLAIDGWNRYRGNEKMAQTDFDNYVSTATKRYSEAIEEQEAVMNNGSFSAEKKARARELKAQYESSLEGVKQSSNRVDRNNVEQMGYALNRADVVNNMANLFSGRISETYEVDEKFYKDEDLKISRAKLELDALKHEAEMKKLGKKADGTPATDNAEAYDTSSTINQETPNPQTVKAVKDSHNQAYKTVVSEVMNAYNDSTTGDEVKKIFNANLRANGFDIEANGAVVPLQGYKGVQHSKADVLQKAFFESKMNATHIEASNVISKEWERKSALSRAIVESEKDSYKELENPQALVSYIEDLTDLKKSYISPITSLTTLSKIQPTTKEIELAKKAENFILENGGVEALKNKIKSNPNLILEMKDLAQERDRIGTGRGSSFDFGNMDENMGKKLKDKGVLPFVKSQFTGSIIEEDEREAVISRMVQDSPTTSALFDAKAPMSVKQDSQGIWVTQSKGVLERMGKVAQTKASATHFFPKESAGYKYIARSLNLKAEDALDVKDMGNNYIMRPIVKPSFVELESIEQEEDFITSYSKLITDPLLKSKRLDLYSSKQSSLEVLKVKFGTKYSEQQLANLIDRVEQGFKNESFKIEVAPNKNKVNWIVRLKKDGVEIGSNWIGNGTELSDSYRNVVQQFPQLIMMDEVVKYLRKHPNDIDKI